jgi:carbamoyltransferase
MKVLGITGRNRDAAAALAVDGRIVSAATEDSFARVARIGYDLTGGFPSGAVKACLDAAALELGDVDEIVAVDEGAAGLARAGLALKTIDAVEADANQAVMSAPDLACVVVCSAQPPALAVFDRRAPAARGRTDVPGAAGLVAGARALSEALGVDPHDPFASLDRLSLGAEPEFQSEIATAVRWNGDALELQPEQLLAAVRRVAGEHAAGLSDARSLNARVGHARRAIAASFTAELAGVVARVADRARGTRTSALIGVGGPAFANPRFNTELERLLGRSPSFAAVPEPFGRALGAAAGAQPGSVNGSLALGPAFSEEEIKRTLDNCRLDYVYEPDWSRLLSRVSRMLAQGKVVAWFQGAMAFGPRAMGTRSILCDPSNRYARQNLNEYLRHVPLDEPLPVAMAPSQADRCLSTAATSAQRVVDVEVRPECRQSLAAALDWRHAIRLHGVSEKHAPRLVDLLELHYTNTGTPGLIEANLAGPGEPVACTPRDAVRTVYSSAIDALVIGRFLLMKDYWLLRALDQ